MSNESMNTKIESHLKIIDVTDKNNPKSIISKRLFNKKANKKTVINSTDKNSK